MKAWESFFVAEVGAAAVLAGLIFVGITINLQKLLERPLLSRAAWVSLMMLMEVLIVSSFLLIPEQPLLALGIEVVSVGLVGWIVLTVVTFLQFNRSVQDGFVEAQAWYVRVAIFLLSQIIALPIVISGVLLMLHIESGVYWLVPGILTALPYALYMGWVLTIEVNR
jgi:modulator of FtsH protease